MFNCAVHKFLKRALLELNLVPLAMHIQTHSGKTRGRVGAVNQTDLLSPATFDEQLHGSVTDKLLKSKTWPQLSIRL